VDEPKRIALDEPEAFLAWFGSAQQPFRLDAVDVAQVWGLVGPAALAREGTPAPLELDDRGGRPATRFALALGVHDAMRGITTVRPGEEGRTVRLTCFQRFPELEPIASEISHLLVEDPALEDTRRTLYYVLVELLRNVVQHSRDPLGGVVGAQVMHAGRGGYERDMIQVAVADAGIGIPESLKTHYPDVADARVALDQALWPHVSSAFAPGLSGNQQNAGLGLFFIAEMAKLAAGRLLIATRGASLRLEGGPEGTDPRRFEVLPLAFPGTLVAFELPRTEVQDYEGLIATITARARERTPQRAIHHWLRYEDPPAGALRLLVSVAAEDTVAAARFAQETLEPRLLARQTVALDFRNLPICTQSFLHALLYGPLRLAWAKQVEIYVVNAQPAVRSTLELLESYALGG
jgi:anti-anti-sigma regulatory factor